MKVSQSPSPTAVRHARKAAKLTQKAAAELVGRSLNSWYQWEAGERNMPSAMYELFLLKTNQKG